MNRIKPTSESASRPSAHFTFGIHCWRLLLPLLFCAALAAWLLHAHDADMRHLIARLQELDTLDLAARAQAEEDIRSLGINAMPGIIHMLRVRPSLFQCQLDALADTYAWFPFAPKPIAIRHQGAIQACVLLGPIAAAAAEPLSELMVEYPSVHIALALSALGTVSVPVIGEKLIHPNEDTRYFAMLALAYMSHRHLTGTAHADERLGICQFASRISPRTVPALIEHLTHPDVRMRGVAAWTLGKLRHMAETAVPALQRVLADHEPMVRGRAEEALKQINNPTIADNQLDLPYLLNP